MSNQVNQTNQASSNQINKEYIDLITTGCGTYKPYHDEHSKRQPALRWHKPKHAKESNLHIRFRVMNGHKDSMEFKPFDLHVVAEKPKAIFAWIIDSQNHPQLKDKNMSFKFEMGDIRVDVYPLKPDDGKRVSSKNTYVLSEQEEKLKELGFGMTYRGRLVDVIWIKINNVKYTCDEILESIKLGKSLIDVMNEPPKQNIKTDQVATMEQQVASDHLPEDDFDDLSVPMDVGCEFDQTIAAA